MIAGSDFIVFSQLLVLVRVGYVQAFFDGTPASRAVSWDTSIVKMQ